MKKTTFLLAILLSSSIAFSQLKERLKGSKIVTIEQKKTESFDAIEILDDLEIILIKGDKNGVEIEADDNLHEALGIQMNGNTLVLSKVKEISGFKKFGIRVIYTDSFKSVVVKDKAKITALEEIKLNEINFKSLNNSKLYLNLSVKSFSISADDKSHIEMNAKAESGNIILSKNSDIKALISSSDLKCDLYQKAIAEIEGDVINMKLRLDNNSKFNGKKLNNKNAILNAEAYTSCNILAESTIGIEASGSSEIELYGNPKVDLKRFSDNAIIYKKSVIK
ncbi:MAG: GIN domain-containing protein [Flavobacterium sp.]